jgi:hypothetical protein
LPIEDLKSQDPEKALQQDEAWRIVTTIIEEELTAKQRYSEGYTGCDSDLYSSPHLEP